MARAILNVAPAPCPCCNGTLYLTERHNEDGSLAWIASAGSPQIKSDAEGAYITCQHCFKRIGINVLRESAEGVTLEILKEQNCG